MTRQPLVLVVDDEATIRDVVRRYLEADGLQVMEAPDGDTALAMVVEHRPDVVVLDVMMPGTDGIDVLRRIRADGDTYVIMLTARAEEVDRVIGLSVGADDYVTKPFNPRELLARVKAVLRRSRALPRQDEPPRSAELRFDRWTLDTARREIIAEDGVAVPLSTTEFRLLTVFVRRPHIVLSREQLLDLTSGRSLEPFERSIDNQISRLRKKVEADPKSPTVIKTVWGGGYVLACDVEERPK